jgi:hypothetical protein
MDEKGVDPYRDVLTESKYRELFGIVKHPFTGVDYVEYYSQLIRDCGAEVEVILANDPRAVLPYTKNILACDIHTRNRTKRLLREAGAEPFCQPYRDFTTNAEPPVELKRLARWVNDKAIFKSVKRFEDYRRGTG